MERNNNHNRPLQTFVVFVAFLLMAAILFVDNIVLAWVIVGLLGFDALYLTISHGWRWWKGNQSKIALREKFLTFLASLMFLFLMTGTAMFMLAFIYESQSKPSANEPPFIFLNAEYLLRSLACSFQLFTGNIDSNVVDGIKDHQYLKGLISLQSFLSFCCTIAVLLSLAYARVSAYYRLHKDTKIDAEHNHLYVFFGMNDPSRLLAKSIKEREGGKAIVVFVENMAQNDDDTSGLDNIVGLFTHRRQTFMDVDELDARVTFTEVRLCDISSEKIEQGDILGDINLLTLRDLIQKLVKGITDAQLHIFFLSENEDENIRALSVLTLDNTILQAKENNVQQRFYCHARRNGLNHIIEDIAFKHGLDVRTVDSSNLAVELLKADGENHPIRFVEIDKVSTTVKSKFNSLIVGFDEVGRDALKFLYEFGAFVDYDATPEYERRSPFRCIAIDKRMDELKGAFANFAPAVMAAKNNDEHETPLVELKSCDCLGSEFYDNVLTEDLCKTLNYIVIAIGDDELGMTIAIRILNHIRRIRKDLHNMRIFVRSYRPDKEAHMQHNADYYNDGYNKCFKEQNSPLKNDAVIKLFGQSKEIYSYDMIINEALTKKGRTYQASYARLSGDKKLWDERRKNELEKGSLDDIRSLRRKELQDLCNALHADTKVYLLKNSMADDFDWSDFVNRYFNKENIAQREGGYDKIRYTYLTSSENKVVLNLARLEHLRWTASHEMLGYVKAHDGLHTCDERTREHNCLRPWQELDDESREVTKAEHWDCDYKLYDFIVVDNSILLNKDKLLA